MRLKSSLGPLSPEKRSSINLESGLNQRDKDAQAFFQTNSPWSSRDKKTSTGGVSGEFQAPKTRPTVQSTTKIPGTTPHLLKPAGSGRLADEQISLLRHRRFRLLSRGTKCSAEQEARVADSHTRRCGDGQHASPTIHGNKKHDSDDPHQRGTKEWAAGSNAPGISSRRRRIRRGSKYPSRRGRHAS